MESHDKEGDFDGFDGYQEKTRDPGIWLLVATTTFCVASLFTLVWVLSWKHRRQKIKTLDEGKLHSTKMLLRNVLRVDGETRNLLRLGIPLTISACANSFFTTLELMIIARHTTTFELAAYSIVFELVGLTNGILYAPISACKTLCSQALGAGNTKLAGSYMQASILFYSACSAIAFVFWWNHMHSLILWLDWGGEGTALLSQTFVRHYFLYFILEAIRGSLRNLMKIVDHAKEGTFIKLAEDVTHCLVLGVVATIKKKLDLVTIAWVFNIVAASYVVIAFLYVEHKGWLKPFHEGLFCTLSLQNVTAIRQMIKQAGPISITYLFMSTDWAVLTAMAAYMGPAEVAAWSIIGEIWDLFYYATEGMADAGEIRVAQHLGDGRPRLAQFSAYKSLLLATTLAMVTSFTLYILHDSIPAWFSHDKTIITMLSDLVPFVGLANVCMTFGMQCWSLIGAQGKYKVGTWVSFICNWGVCMPLGATFVYAFHTNLQGLMSATTVGYTTCSVILSYVLANTDWEKVSAQVQADNAKEGEEDGTVASTSLEDESDSESEEGVWGQYAASTAQENVLRGDSTYNESAVLWAPACRHRPVHESTDHIA